MVDNISGVTAKQAKKLLERLRHITLQNRIIVENVKAFGSRTRKIYRPLTDLDIVVILSELGYSLIKNNFKMMQKYRKILQSIKNDFFKETKIELDLNTVRWRDIGRTLLFKEEDLKNLE